MTALERRRAKWRRHATRKRAAKLERRRFGLATCPRRFGRHGTCGAQLEYETLRSGRVRVSCPACDRMARGVCADCPRPVTGRAGYARRCAECRHRALRRSQRNHTEHHRTKINARSRRAHRTDAERRKRRNAYKRLWRLANPDKVAAQKRRFALRQTEGHARYHADYRERRRAQIAAAQLARYHGEVAARVCVACERAPVSGRRKKCDDCRDGQRRVARDRLAAHRGRGRRTDLE